MTPSYDSVTLPAGADAKRYRLTRVASSSPLPPLLPKKGRVSPSGTSVACGVDAVMRSAAFSRNSPGTGVPAAKVTVSVTVTRCVGGASVTVEGVPELLRRREGGMPQRPGNGDEDGECSTA